MVPLSANNSLINIMGGLLSSTKIYKMQNDESGEIMVKTNKAEGKKCPVCWKINTKPCERHFS